MGTKIPQTTIETLTDAQIEQLRTEAAEAGDRSMVAVCDTALGMGRLASRLAVAWARRECVTVITSHQAEVGS